MTTRERIAEAVAAEPGIHFRELARTLDLAPGQVQYHVRRLEDASDVVSETLYGRTHYYEPSYDEFERHALALARRETPRHVLVELADGDVLATGLADDLGVARSTLAYHVDRLVDADLVAKRRDERNRVVLSLVDERRTVSILATVQPSLPGRLVDRFERLLDTYLE